MPALPILADAFAANCDSTCGNGFCVAAAEDDYCECITGWTGADCQTEIPEATSCTSSCVNGVCNDSNACECDPGYDGSFCDEKIDDYDPCESMMCNGHGSCFISEYEETLGKALCECDAGYGGLNCETNINQCSYDVFLDVAQTIFDENAEFGRDCKYWIAAMFFTMDETERGSLSYVGTDTLFSGISFCTCLNNFQNQYSKWAGNLGCSIEPIKKWSVKEMADLHCPDFDNECTAKRTMSMKNALKDYSVECDAFITDRANQSLTWRTPSKCSCMNSLGSREHAARMVYCPFSQHPAGSDILSYDACVGTQEEVCDFVKLKDLIIENMRRVYPPAVETCTQALRTFTMQTPDDASFTLFNTATNENWCTCTAMMGKYWAEGLDLIDCVPVTFYKYTWKDIFGYYCFDAVVSNRASLWNLYNPVMAMGHFQPSMAAVCYHAIVLTVQTAYTGYGQERALEMSCLCINSIAGAYDSRWDDPNIHEYTQYLAYHPLSNKIQPRFLSTYGVTTDYCLTQGAMEEEAEEIVEEEKAEEEAAAARADDAQIVVELDADASLVDDGYTDSAEQEYLLLANGIVGGASLLLAGINTVQCFRTWNTGSSSATQFKDNLAV